MKKLPVLDTNIIIRFLAADSLDQALKVKTLFESTARKTLMLPDLVIAEIIYVLLSLYELSKEDIIEKVDQLVEIKAIKCNKPLIKKTLDIFRENSVSFVDSYLCALIITGKNSMLYSFDKRLGKVLGGKAPGLK